MSRDTLVDDACITLIREGYAIKRLHDSCFDLVARGTEHMILLRVVSDANGLSKEGCEEMQRAARMIDAVPLVVARSAGQRLDDGVVYMRFGLYTMTVETFKESLQDNLPLIRASTAGLTLSFSGDSMRQAREQLGLSRGDLAREIGVSSRMVDQYEADEAEVTVMRGIRIMELLGEEIFKSYNPFDLPPFPSIPQDVELSDVSVKYAKLGFEVSEFKKAPFDIIARQDRELIVTEVGDIINPEMSPMSKLLDAENLVIYEEHAPDDLSLPSMSKEDFLEIRKSKELVRFLRDF